MSGKEKLQKVSSGDAQIGGAGALSPRGFGPDMVPPTAASSAGHSLGSFSIVTPSTDLPIQRQEEEESSGLLNSLRRAGGMALNAGEGFVEGLGEGFVPGATLLPSTNPHSRLHEGMRGAGQAIGGAIGTVGGAGGAAGSVAVMVATDGTTVPVLTPAAVEAGAYAAGEAGNTAVGASHMWHAMTGDDFDDEDAGYRIKGRQQNNSGRGGRSMKEQPSGTGSKNDTGQIQSAANEQKMTPEQRRDFGKYVEDLKKDGERGSHNDRGDFTYGELQELARQYMAGKK